MTYTANKNLNNIQIQIQLLTCAHAHAHAYHISSVVIKKAFACTQSFFTRNSINVLPVDYKIFDSISLVYANEIYIVIFLEN